MLFLFYRYLNVSNCAGNLHESEWTVNLYDKIVAVSSTTSSVPFFFFFETFCFPCSLARFVEICSTPTHVTRRKSKGPFQLSFDFQTGFGFENKSARVSVYIYIYIYIYTHTHTDIYLNGQVTPRKRMKCK